MKDFYLHQLNDGMAYLDTGLSAMEEKELINDFYKEQCVQAEKAVFTYIILKRLSNDRPKTPIYEFYKRSE